MLSILFSALFASGTLAAQVTTSVWLPGAANANQTLLGSVVQQNGEYTILALSLASTPSTPDYYSRAPNTVTVGGTTFVAYNVSASDPANTNAAPVTIELQCNRKSGTSAIPTCTMSTVGANRAVSAVCAGLSVSSLPEYCTESNAVRYEQTETLAGESQYNHPLVITAGTEKLEVSAGAMPKASSASITQSGTGTGTHRDATGPLQTMSGSNSVQQATSAAAPVKTMGPALARLGAVAVAIFL